jgi:ABC-type uncharacterized transport system fused permease/ATPase subunit
VEIWRCELHPWVVTIDRVAFSAIVAAFSLIVTQFQSLSNYAAVTARLSAMVELTEAVQPRRWKRTAILYDGVLESREDGGGTSMPKPRVKVMSAGTLVSQMKVWLR